MGDRIHHALPTAWWRRLSMLLGLALLSSCGLISCETPIERERRELREAGETPEVLIYRALKIGMRSTATKLNPEGPDANATKINLLVRHILAELEAGQEAEAGAETGEAIEPLSPADYVEIAKELYELRAVLRETNEDRYPTILHVLMAGDASASAQMAWYESTHEHMAFALAWLAVKQVPQGFRVYETGMIDPAAIELPGLRLGAHLVRGATFLAESWPWLCDEEMSGYLDLLVAEREPLLVTLAAVQAASEADVTLDDEQLLASAHAPGVLLRGLCRIQIEEKEAGALDDLEAFLADAERLGIEGEAVWLVGAYVGIKREDKAMALDNLRKLEASELLGESERELVRDAIAAIEDREPGDALNAITDKLILARVASAYVIRELGKVEWRQHFEASEGGKKITRLSGIIAAEVEQIRSKLSLEELGGLRESASRWYEQIGCGAN